MSGSQSLLFVPCGINLCIPSKLSSAVPLSVTSSLSICLTLLFSMLNMLQTSPAQSTLSVGCRQSGFLNTRSRSGRPWGQQRRTPPKLCGRGNSNMRRSVLTYEIDPCHRSHGVQSRPRIQLESPYERPCMEILISVFTKYYIISPMEPHSTRTTLWLGMAFYELPALLIVDKPMPSRSGR